MKKQLLLLLCLALFSFKYKAQFGLGNLSFENWSTNPMGLAPSGWFGTGLTKKTSGAQQGNNYASLSPDNINSGFLMLGNLASLGGTVTGGAPYTQVPVSISGFYKASGISTSSASPFMNAYTKDNGQLNTMAAYTFTANTNSWTSFSAPFYPTQGNPAAVDSMFILFNIGVFGSSTIFDIDNVSIQSMGVVGIDKHSIGTNFLVYPNPAHNELTILSKTEKTVNLMLMSIDGKIIKSEMLNEGDTKINLTSYPAGIYIYQILDSEQNVLLRSKMVVER